MLCFFVCLCMREKERSSTRECEREVFCFKTDSAFKAVLFSLFFRYLGTIIQSPQLWNCANYTVYMYIYTIPIYNISTYQ